MTQVDAGKAEQVRQALEKITSSLPFVRSRLLCRFLTFIVEAAIGGREDQIKEHAIGVQVFERGDAYNISRDNIVRIEAARLRHKLREYYESEGCGDAVRIRVPKGAYVPVFDFAGQQPARPDVAEAQTSSPARHRSWPLIFIAIAGVAICGSVLLAFRTFTPKVNPQARILYQKGRFLWGQRTRPSLIKSVEVYRQAIRLEPDYADAWTGLADSYAVLAGNDYPDSRDFVQPGIAAAGRAIRLAPVEGRPHAALGGFYVNLENWDAAEREARLSVQLSPRDATAHQWYGHMLLIRRRFDEVLVELRRAEQLDPLQPIIGVNIGDVYRAKGDYGAALRQFHKTLDLQADCVAAGIGIALVKIDLHRYQEALTYLERWLAMFPDDPGLNAAADFCRRELHARPPERH